MFGLILLFTFLSSIISLLLVTAILLRTTLKKSLILALTSFAVGVLLATSFLDLLPEAQEKGGASVFVWTLAGMILFFVFEQFFFWYHHHRAHGEIKPSVVMITFGDALHNFIDGVAIGVSFLTSFQLGVFTSFAVFAHEIPHEIADVSIYLASGLTKKKTLLFNLASGATALLGAGASFLFSRQFQLFLPAVLAFAAGNFIYIAASDLIPELHHQEEKTAKPLPKVIMFLGGILVVVILKLVLER